MGLFNRLKKSNQLPTSGLPLVMPTGVQGAPANTRGGFEEVALRTIEDGIIVTDERGIINLMNPAAITMTGLQNDMLGMDYKLVLKVESRDGEAFTEENNPVYAAAARGQNLERFPCVLVAPDGNEIRRTPITVSVLLSSDGRRIIDFRNVAAEVAKEEEQTEFISTASHEMRTPVASIEGYLGLALNPQTATIDARAKKYLDAAHAAAKHLGELFRDLLDTTKLDDRRVAPKLRPVELISLTREFVMAHLMKAEEAGVSVSFSPADHSQEENGELQIAQKIYCSVDVDFLREIVDNLVDNAIKYTSSGGAVTVSVKAEPDRAVISVADNGMGISVEDLKHIFQKFYRADNSDTRTIGGTGLGLYLAKQRTEALGGSISAESSFGNGSTFTVVLPRISSEEYEKRMIMVKNEEAARIGSEMMMAPGGNPGVANPAVANPVVANPVSTSPAMANPRVGPPGGGAISTPTTKTDGNMATVPNLNNNLNGGHNE